MTILLKFNNSSLKTTRQTTFLGTLIHISLFSMILFSKKLSFWTKSLPLLEQSLNLSQRMLISKKEYNISLLFIKSSNNIKLFPQESLLMEIGMCFQLRSCPLVKNLESFLRLTPKLVKKLKLLSLNYLKSHFLNLKFNPLFWHISKYLNNNTQTINIYLWPLSSSEQKILF